eukprot:gene2914-3201_t
MAFKQMILALACLAIVANAPLAAAQCNTTLQTQSATIKTQVPKGCVARAIESGEFPLDNASCLNDLILNVTNTTGVDCDEAATYVSVALKNTSCFEGEAGTANLTTLKAGGYSIKGAFVVGTGFTGKQSADAKSMTVSVENITCELTYDLKALTKAVVIAADADADEDDSTALNSTAANGTEAPAGASPAGAPPAAEKKSSAAGLSGFTAVVIAVLGAVAAALAL